MKTLLHMIISGKELGVTSGKIKKNLLENFFSKTNKLSIQGHSIKSENSNIDRVEMERRFLRAELKVNIRSLSLKWLNKFFKQLF